MGNAWVGSCWGCGGFGHRVPACPGRSLPVVGPNGPLAGGVVGEGSVKRAGGHLGGAPAGRGGTLRGASVLGYVGTSHAPGGGAPLGAR